MAKKRCGLCNASAIKKGYQTCRQYNHTRLVVNGAHVEHWLNGVKVADLLHGHRNGKN